MRIRRVAATVAILVSTILYGFSAIETTGGEFFSVKIDAGAPMTIEWPCEIAIVDDNGKKGLRIGPNIGRGWRGEAAGHATYKFYVPRDGAYHIWAYALWFDECANAIFAQIDDSRKAILGNDPIYNQWHWVRGFERNLAQGSHTLVMSNHSDHISIQKILLTNSSSIAPTDYDLVFSDLFYDGFDGCDHGNFTSWRQVSGEWTIHNLKEDAYNPENALLGRSQDEALILYQNDTWQDYSLNVSVRLMPTTDANATAGICFGVLDLEHYYQLTWQLSANRQSVDMMLIKKNGDQRVTLGAFSAPWTNEAWHDFEVSCEESIIKVTADDFEPFEVSVYDAISGGIGLYLEGNIEAHFDDIHVRQIDCSKSSDMQVELR